jgi:hypothetical protein
MKKNVLLAAVLAALPFASIAAEQPKAAAIAVAEAEAIVELVSVDRATHIAVVRTPSGAMLSINVPPEAQNLDRVKPGDRFRMRYIEAIALALQKGGDASVSGGQAVQLAPKGGNPGGTIVNTKQLTTVVTAVDRPSRTIQVRGPETQPITLKVAEDVRSFSDIAVGDTIGVTYTEALAVEMVAPAGAQ